MLSTEPDLHASISLAPSRRSEIARLFPLLLAVVGAGVYQGSLWGQFVLDSIDQIAMNPRIRSLWPDGAGGSVLPAYLRSSRPVVEASFALNYALGGVEPAGYQLVNVLVHVAAAITLYGLIRRVLALPALAGRYRQSAAHVAFAASLLWMVHPLTTQAVTYTIQRSESMMALFYLLTLYCVVRCVQSSRELAWLLLAALCFTLGLGSKVVIATAPLLVVVMDGLLMDFAFARVIRRQWRWVLLLLGVTAAAAFAMGLPSLLSRTGGSAGFGVTAISSQQYAATQPEIILHYLTLALWPVELCLDYAWPAVPDLRSAGPAAGFMGVLIILSLVGALRRWRAAFLPLAFFLILAPTSSFIPIYDLAAEHRMYLPLAALITGLVLAVDEGLAQLKTKAWIKWSTRRTLAVMLVLGFAVPLAGRTIVRNRDYHDPLDLWRQVVDQQPASYRAHNNLGMLLLARNQPAAAMPHLHKAMMIPDRMAATTVQANIAKALVMLNRPADALEILDRVILERPRVARFHMFRGDALLSMNNTEEAVQSYTAAVLIEPWNVDAVFFLGNALLQANRPAEAIAPLQRAVAIEPSQPDLHSALGLALLRSGDAQGATRQFQLALQLDPNHAQTLCNLGELSLMQGHIEHAISQLERALQLAADFPDAHRLLGKALLSAGQPQQAQKHLEAALPSFPNKPGLHMDVAQALLDTGQREGVVAALEPIAAQRLSPEQRERALLLLKRARAVGVTGLEPLEAKLEAQPATAPSQP